MKSSFIIIILTILDKSSNDGFTKEFVGVVIVVEVEGVVEELELGVEAINGGSDTMKSNMKKRKISRSRVKSKEESKEEIKFDELNLSFLISFIH